MGRMHAWLQSADMFDVDLYEANLVLQREIINMLSVIFHQLLTYVLALNDDALNAVTALGLHRLSMQYDARSRFRSIA